MAAQTTVLIPLTDCTLKRGTPNTKVPATITVDTVENVSLKVTWDKPDSNNRKSRIKQKLVTMAEVGLEINFPGDSDDTHLAAFKTACVLGQPIPVLCTDGIKTFTGLMGVESSENDQPLAGIDGYKFSLFPWAVGASGTQPALS